MAKGEVRYRLVLDSKDFVNGIKAAKQEAASLGNDMAGKLGAAGNVLRAMGPAGMGAAIGIGAVTAAFGLALKATVDAVAAAVAYEAAIGKIKDQTNLSAQSIQAFAAAAKVGDASLEAVAKGVVKMQKGLSDGNVAFGKLGLSIQQLKAMSPEAAFTQVAQAIQSLETPVERTAARIDVFGKGGSELAGTLAKVASGAVSLGGALSDDALEATAQLGDKMDLLDLAVDRVVAQFGAAVAQSPELLGAIDDLTDLAVRFAEALGAAAPKIAAFFDSIVLGSRVALAGMKLLSTFEMSSIVSDFARGQGLGATTKDALARFNSDVDQIALDSMFSDVQGGGTGPRRAVGTYRGQADDAAAKAAAAAAERARAAWQKASEDARASWDKFYEEFEKRGRETVWGMEDDIAKRVKAMAPTGNEPDGPIAKLKAYNDMVKAVSEDAKKVDALDAEYAQRADARLLYKIGLVGELGSAFQDLGTIVGGVFGSIIGGLGSITQGISSAMASIRQMKTSGGGLQGMLGKASGALGLAGAAFSVGKIVWGGLKSLFGGKSEEEKAAEAQKIKDTTAQLQSLMDKAKSLKMDQLKGGVSGLAAIFDHLATKTDVAGERFRRLEAFGMDLFRKLKAEGMSTSEAFDALGPSLDSALAAAKANGQELGGTFGQLAQFRQLVQDNAGLVSAVDGLNKLVTAIGLTRDSFATVRPEMMAFYDEMIGKGFTADQAIGEIAPTLFAIREAARAGRIEVDETTKALIAQAEAGGHFDNLKDPMKELVEVQKMMLELWAAIAQMQGVTLPASLREYIATLHQAQSAQSGLGSGYGGGIQNKYDGEDVSYPETPGESGHGASGYHGILGRGPLPGGGTPLVGHPGEEAYLGPPGGNSGITGGMLSMTTILRINETELGRAQTGMLRKNKGGVSSGTARYGARG